MREKQPPISFGDWVVLMPDPDGKELAVPLMEAGMKPAPWKTGFMLLENVGTYPDPSSRWPIYVPALSYDQHFELRTLRNGPPIYSTPDESLRFERAYDDLLRTRGSRKEVDAGKVLPLPRSRPKSGDPEFGNVVWSASAPRVWLPWNFAVLVISVAQGLSAIMFYIALGSLLVPTKPERRWRRWHLGQCPNCAYPRPPLPASICPECGEPLALTDAPVPPSPATPASTPTA